MSTSNAKDRITLLANGVACQLDPLTNPDGSKVFKSGTTYESRLWQGGLPGYMIWWSGIKILPPNDSPAPSNVRANQHVRLRYTATLGVAFDANEQKAQEDIRAISILVINALALNPTLGGAAPLGSAIAGGETRVVEAGGKKFLELPLEVFIDWAGPL